MNQRLSRRLLQTLTMLTRVQIPQEKISWEVEWKDYKPNQARADFFNKPWADPEIG
jgi:hypothetical protein